MVRITGSVEEANSLSSPTGEPFSSVVRRIRGKRAKRISGNESSAATNTEPTPSRAARNERRLSRFDADGLRVEDSESAAPSNMLCLGCRESLLGWQASDVRYQFGYIVRLDLCAKRRHFPSALRDDFTERGLALLLNFVGAEILGVHCLAGWAVSTAIGRVT